MRSNKKGFTIVELVIVIAVIAILAAVLIPTIAGLVKKAQQSADIQAVRQMNTALASAENVPANIIAAAEILSDAGFNTEKGLTPAYKGYSFYWFKPANQVVYVNDADGKFELIFPEKIKDFNEDGCQSLEIAIDGTVNAPAVSENSTEVGANLNASIAAPSTATTFESTMAWLNTLSGHQNITCTVNGVPNKTGVAISNDIKLSEDVVIDVHNGASTLVLCIVGEVTIDLNGHSITQYGQQGASQALFVVSAGSTLNIIDSSSDKSGGIYASYTAVQISSGGTLNLYSGTVGVTPSEHRRSEDGVEPLFVYGGTVNMYGGKIDSTVDGEESWAIGNSYPAMASTATVNLYGGEIKGWVDITDIDNYNNYGVSVTGEYDANAQ